MKRKILISTSSFGKVNPEPLLQLQNAGFEVTLNPYGKTMTEEQSCDALKGHVGLIAGTEKLTANTFDSNPQLEYVCRLGTGMDNVDLKGAKTRGIPVDNTPDAHVDGVAELCLAGMLNLCRNVGSSHLNMKQDVWKKSMGQLLRNKTLGLIGLGKVSKRLIELVAPFGLKIIAFDPFWDADFANNNAVEQGDLNEVMSKSDLVSLHIPFTAENKNLISAKELALMKQSAYLINTSRGGIINEEDLYQYLQNNQESKAYVDVYEKEPYSGKLAELDNILLTPHIGTYAKEVRINMELECVTKLTKHFTNNG